MSLGIQLIFQRERSIHFRTSGDQRANVASYVYDLNHVLGSFDYLTPRLVESLSKLFSDRRMPNHTRSWEGPRLDISDRDLAPSLLAGDTSIVLLPPSTTGTNVRARLGDLKAGVTAIIRVSLTSHAIDTPGKFKDARDHFERVPEILTSLFSETCHGADMQMSAWNTLGGPDFVCLLNVTSTQELQFALNYVAALRSTRLSKLLANPGAGNVRHLFASVQMNLVFKYGGANQPIQGHYEEGGSTTLEYFCRMSPGPGHERECLEKITSAGIQAPSRAVISSGYRSLQLTFDSLTDLVHAIDVVSRTEENGHVLRNSDLYNVRSAIGSIEDPTHREHTTDAPGAEPLMDIAIPQLSPEICELLRDIKSRFEDFAAQYLGATFLHEFDQVFSTLSVAICRSDRTNSVRDLLPFADQLSRALTEDELWDKLFPDDAEAIRDQFSSIMDHLWTAIRNRIEHRGEPSDPSFPNTIEFGASKLVNAYTTAAWLACRALFLTTRESNCGARGFAAAVAAGTEGSVRVTQVFPNLYPLDTDSPIERRTEDEWNSNLYLLKISGPALFRPELTMVLCLHEMAEFSGWTKCYSQLNSVINSGLFDYMTCRLLTDLDLPATQVTVEILTALLSQDDQVSQRSVFGPLAERELRRRMSPTDYWRTLSRRIQMIDRASLVAATGRARSSQVLTGHTPPEWTKILLENAPESPISNLLTVFAKLEKTLRELVADFAMCLGLFHYLDDESEKVAHINHLFTSMLECSLESSPDPANIHLDGMLLRWAFQISVFSDREAKLDFVCDQMNNYRSRIESAIHSTRAKATFAPEKWAKKHWQTMGILPSEGQFDLAEYFRQSIPFARLWRPTTDEPASVLVEEFRNVWDKSFRGDGEVEAARCNLIQLLWLKANRFRVGHVAEI